MLRNFHLQKNSTAPRWSLSRRGRAPTLLLISTFILGSVVQSARAAPSADTIWIIPKLEAAPADITICPNKSTWIYVTYHEVIYKATRHTTTISGPIDGPPQAGVSIEGTVLDSSIGKLLNPRLDTRSWGGSVWAPFRFKASSNLGDTTITFASDHDVLSPLGYQSVTTLPITSATVNVHVECKFTVVVSSRWQFPGPHTFRPAAHFVASSDITPNPDGAFEARNIPLTTYVRPTVQLPYCSTQMDVTSTTADMTGKVDWERDTIDITLTFGSVTATTSGKCPTPVGAIIFENLSEGEAMTLNPRSLQFSGPLSGFSVLLPHELETQPNNVSGQAVLAVFPR